MNKEHDILFVPVVWSYVKSYNIAKDDFVKKKLKEGAIEALKKWTDQPVTWVSKRVLEKCEDANPEIDPFSMLWTERKRLGIVEKEGGKSKSWAAWEHSTPLTSFFNETLKKCNKEEEIERAMDDYSGVCLISRKEDDCLNENGYQRKRPGGWRKCYEECGIEIVPRPN